MRSDPARRKSAQRQSMPSAGSAPLYGEWIRLRSCVRATRRHRQIDCKNLAIGAAQSGKTDSQPQSQTSTQQEMTLNGCVARGTTTGAQSATFMLNNAQ